LRQKNRFILQWHITERCNQRCLHCYQDNFNSSELSFEKLLNIVKQFKELLIFYNSLNFKQFVKGRIYLTGGEPFVREDFKILVEHLCKEKEFFDVAILCNGTFIDENVAKWLKTCEIRFVQISVEGDEKTHNFIRGENNFEKIKKAIHFLTKFNISVSVSFTASQENYKMFPEVAKFCRKMKVDTLWTDRIVPFGNHNLLKNKTLTQEQFYEYLDLIYKEKNRFSLFSKTKIEMKRSLQFLKTGETPYRCSAGESLLAVLPNGDIFPCRRMPIFVGNILEKSLKEIYLENSVLKNLRDNSQKIKGCEDCFFLETCFGGAKCISFALEKNLFLADNCCKLRKI